MKISVVTRAHPLRHARLWLFAIALVIAAGTAAAAECGPSFNAGGPDADAYGAKANYPVGTMGPVQLREQRFLVGLHVSFDKLRPGPEVVAPPSATPLARNCDPFQFSYRFKGQQYTLDDYLARHPATGLLIAKGPNILVERYQYGRRDTDRFVSQSMAKTITAMLFGVALTEGKIRSLDDRAQDYVPGLKDSAYGETSLRSLLSMGSGVAFSQTYADDDSAEFSRGLTRPGSPGAAVLLRKYKREAPEGVRFHYANSETEILGLVLAAATGSRLTDYASERLWKPMGAEANAQWSTDARGEVMTFCCFSARLRDWARLGLLLANDGGGVIPAAWVIEATSAPEGSWHAPRKATPFWGYGYQTWLLPARRRIFALRGIHGQTMFVDPATKLVLVHTAVQLRPAGDPAVQELNALWYALMEKVGGTPAR